MDAASRARLAGERPQAQLAQQAAEAGREVVVVAGKLFIGLLVVEYDFDLIVCG